MDHLVGKRILVTGVCGTVGSELVAALLNNNEYPIAELVGVDNNESGLFFLDQRFNKDKRARFYLADIRDNSKLMTIMSGIDLVFHAAAFKHVVLSERSPFEAVQTNILGVQNVIQAAQHNKVEKVIFTSTDKAVNPTNVMGTSKLMGERLITAANTDSNQSDTILASTRFGNVMGSNGSVVPVFKQQIANGGPVTITDTAMTRFVMSIEQSVRLVIESARIAKGGEVFITKMPVIRIVDLAEVMINESAAKYGHNANDIEMKIIGSKPGEKLYEELMSLEETRRALELPDYFVVLPAFRGYYSDVDYSYEDIISEKVENPYISSEEDMLDQQQLHAFLTDNDLL